MKLEEEDKAGFKQWLLPKLETISDAEAGVLADYVIALITAGGPVSQVKQNCIDNLSDFLQDHTPRFVDDVADAIAKRSWSSQSGSKPDAAPKQPKLAPSAPIPSIIGSSAEPYLPSPALSAEAKPFNPRGRSSHNPLSATPPSGPSKPRNRPPDRPTGPSLLHRQAGPQVHGKTVQNGKGSQSRKRKLNDRESSQTRDSPGAYQSRNFGERPFKQVARRGGGSGRGGSGMNGPGHANLLPPSIFPTLPTAPVGVPPIDLNNPMALFATMAAMMGMNFPNAIPAQIPQFGASSTGGKKERCRDYDKKGFCLRGSACPYEHVAAPKAAVPEYDPNDASIGFQSLNAVNGRSTAGRRQNDMRSNGVSSGVLAHAQAPHTNDTLVIESIPEENFSQDQIRDFFSQFGQVVEVQLKPYKRIAVIRFDGHVAAQRAHDSPKSVFDNRFVKVYWHNRDHVPARSGVHGVRKAFGGQSDEDVPEIYKQRNDDEEMIDWDEFERQQAEAQKAFEEKRQKAEEAAARSEQITNQLRVKEGEVKDLRTQLIGKAREKGIEVINRREGVSSDDPLLMGDLSTLQAEAEGFFTNQDSTEDARIPPGLGRGSYRGGIRARGYRPSSLRGRGYPRGAYRARGARCGVKRLDNRPRRVAIAGIWPGSKRDEAVRQHLLNVQGCEAVYAHTDRPNILIVAFSERYLAEIFLDEAAHIPDVGKLELFWVPKGVSEVSIATTKEPYALHRDVDDESSTADEEEIKIKEERGEEQANGAEADLDVADDMDQWL